MGPLNLTWFRIRLTVYIKPSSKSPLFLHRAKYEGECKVKNGRGRGAAVIFEWIRDNWPWRLQFLHPVQSDNICKWFNFSWWLHQCMLLIQLRKLCFYWHFIDLHALYKLIDLNIISTHTDLSLVFFQEEITSELLCGYCKSQYSMWALINLRINA